MELTTQKEVDDTVTQVQSELVKSYVSDSYQELEYEYTDPTSDLVTPTLPDWEPIVVTFRVATPIFTPVAGSYTSAQTVTILCTTSGATIYYTTNGKTPDENSTKYTAPLTVSADVTIKAKAFKDGMTESYTATGGYTITVSGTDFSSLQLEDSTGELDTFTVTNIEFYSGGWISKFNNTYWSATTGSWSGSAWLPQWSDGSRQLLTIEPIGTWAQNYRPTHIRVTFASDTLPDLDWFYLHTRKVWPPASDYMSLTELVTTW